MNPNDKTQAVTKATAPPPKLTVKDYLEKAKGSIAQALPRHLSADRFLKTVLVSLNTNPKLLACSKESILNCVMASAQLGLEPGPLGHVYLIPYGNVAQFQLGYKGLLELVTRTGQIEVINAMAICEKDTVIQELGFNERLEIKLFEGGDRGPVVKYVAYAKTKGGGKVFKIMTKAEVEKHRNKYSKAHSQAGSAWTTSFDEMACKTVLLQIMKYLPKSIELQKYIEEAPTGTLDPALAMPDHDFTIEGEVEEVPTPDKPVVMMDEAPAGMGTQPKPTESAQAGLGIY